MQVFLTPVRSLTHLLLPNYFPEGFLCAGNTTGVIASVVYYIILLKVII